MSDSFSIPWTVALQASESMGFSREENWCGLPFPSPRNLPDPGIKPASPALQADSVLSEPPGRLIQPVAAAAKSAAHQAPLSLGFSRQEHWSELPFPSPMHESEKLK